MRLLACVQAQERDHALFSLGMRARRATYASVRAELDAGGFLRTHILRPTWHFVAPEDLRWILDLTSPRVLASMGAQHRQLGLDDPRAVSRALDALAALLEGRSHLTRRQIGERLAGRRGLPPPGQALGHLLGIAELRGLICSGPTAGAHHTYALVDEVVPPAPRLHPAEAHARLALRFFAGHGPASVADFTRWSSLTVAGTKAALGELGDRLDRVEMNGVAHWHDPAAPPRRSRAAPRAFLLPVYDEVVLTYPAVNFPEPPDRPAPDLPGSFWAPVVADGRLVGSWRRTLAGDRVVVEARLAPSLPEAGRAAVAGAARRLAAFLGRELEYATAARGASGGMD